MSAYDAKAEARAVWTAKGGAITDRIAEALLSAYRAGRRECEGALEEAFCALTWVEEDEGEKGLRVSTASKVSQARYAVEGELIAVRAAGEERGE